MKQGETEGSTVVDLLVLSREELIRLERQLIPLLNTVRALLGKRPVIIVNEERAHN